MQANVCCITLVSDIVV